MVEGVEKGAMETWQRLGHTLLGADKVLCPSLASLRNSGKGKGSGSSWLQEKPRVWQSSLASPRTPGHVQPKMYLSGLT